jgi:hypothetical protein
MYRHTRRTPLSSGQRQGDIIQDGDLKPKTIQALLSAGTLVRVSTPPLSELPGWKTRAKLLAKAGIITVQDFIEADKAKLIKVTKKTATTVNRWKAEAKKAIEVNPPPDDHD